MRRYFELGVYNKEKSDGTGVLGQYSSFNEAKEAISGFTKGPEQIFIIDELEEQEDDSVRQLGEWLYK
jgi:rRNA processing protein Krr1/Pno1